MAGMAQSIYLRSADGQIVWLAPREVPLHRRGVRLASWSACPSSGGSYRVSDRMELVAPGLRLDLRAAPTWDPPSLPRRRPPPSADGLWGLHLAQAVLTDLPEPNGFGTFLPMILGPAGPEPTPAPIRGLDASIGAQGLRAALGVAQACRAGDVPRILSQAEGLVGLGDGLTPSGDDFLGGVLFGLAAIRRDDRGDANRPSLELSGFLRWARQRTSEISGQLLHDHAEGHGCEVLAPLTRGLLERWPVRAVLPAARALIGLGHSTGWSLLAGVWTALALFPSHPEQVTISESSAGIPALG
jgi:hypothetical protein